MPPKHLIVIGGGAAGFFCAVNAARMDPSLKVSIVEKSNKLLSKVRISGGGRCNVTHDCDSISGMVRQYPRGADFLKKAFHHFFVSDTFNWFKERGIELKTEVDGRVFPVSDNSQTIIDCLLREANRYGVDILLNRELKSMVREEDQWVLSFAGGEQMKSDKVVIATGGYPKPLQYEWIKRPGHSIEDPVPSLFTFNMPGNAITSLMGVTLPEVTVRIKGSKLSETGPLLVTHWGLSGPVILTLSARGARELARHNYQFSINVSWLPKTNETRLRERFLQLRFDLAAQKVVNRNPFGLPARFWEYLLKEAGIGEQLRWADLPAKEQHLLIKNLCSQEFKVSGKTTFKEEFVTAGGVKLEEIDFNTMQSRILPGLFFAGEVLNVDGVTGGYNFQNAWTTGWIAARGVVGEG